MFNRRRFKQTVSLQERLSVFANELREKAANAASSVERDKLLKRARQADIALHLPDWANSPGLQAPK
jgi:hypothetical protein